MRHCRPARCLCVSPCSFLTLPCFFPVVRSECVGADGGAHTQEDHCKGRGGGSGYTLSLCDKHLFTKPSCVCNVCSNTVICLTVPAEPRVTLVLSVFACLHLSLTFLSLCVFHHQLMSPLNLEQASSARDALAKAVYGRTFTWLVNKINASLTYTVYTLIHTVDNVFSSPYFSV